MEQPLHCSFNEDNRKIAFSFPNGMWIYGIKENSWLLSVENIYFSLFMFSLQKLIGVEDNYVKAWDTCTNEVVTKLIIASGFPSAMHIFGQNELLAIGTTCGHVNIYGKNNRLIRNIPIWRIVALNQKDNCNDEDKYKDIKSDSFPVHSILAFNLNSNADLIDCLPEEMYLLVVTSSCLFIISINSEAVPFYQDFNDDLTSDVASPTPGLIRSAFASADSTGSVIYVSLIPLVGESIVLCKLFLEKIILTETGYSFSNNTQLTFSSYRNSSGDSKSLLNHTMQSNHKTKNLKKSSSTLNQPVTFHSNIKSSGYGTIHKSVKLFQPQVRRARPSESLDIINIRKPEERLSETKMNFCEFDKEINYMNLSLMDKLELSDTAAVSNIHTTVNGMYACCPAPGGHVDIIKVAKKTMRVHQTLSCHNGEVNTARWSHTGKLIITGGNDKACKLWDLENSKQNHILTIGHEEKLKSNKHHK